MLPLSTQIARTGCARLGRTMRCRGDAETLVAGDGDNTADHHDEIAHLHRLVPPA
ncbi:hypothetical protein [Streptomyces sp. 4N124]|uniref:hypothetical protein n=1 Tax=Streptomyces sp. 4N124 TaxID=3457420 RepID=UPI003FD5F583